MFALVAYEDLFEKFSGDLMTVQTLTLASACARNFRLKHLEEETIAIIPEGLICFKV